MYNFVEIGTLIDLPLHYLCVIVESTKEGCVEDKDAAKQLLVGTEVPGFDQEVVVTHL